MNGTSASAGDPKPVLNSSHKVNRAVDDDLTPHPYGRRKLEWPAHDAFSGADEVRQLVADV